MLVDGATALPVFYARAPQGTQPPYVIFQRQDGRDEHTFNSKGLNADYVVKVVSKDMWPTGAQRAYDAIHGMIEGGGTVVVSGFNLLRFERQATIEYQDPGQFWHVGGLYRVEVWED
jgi:hypothetical protein